MIMLNKFMNLALKKAKECNIDVPICAIIEKNGEIISIQTNKREQLNQTIAHAEILAINEANKKLNSWRLDECNMYVTLEPCPMCMWAIINAKIKNLYFGCYDINYGAAQSAINLAKLANSNINIIGGIKEEENNTLLKEYFKKLRNEK